MVADRQLRPDATVLAVGAHTVDTRELHEDVLRDAQVIVEDVGAARREVGDVLIAVEKKGALTWDDVVTMAEVAWGGGAGSNAAGGVQDRRDAVGGPGGGEDYRRGRGRYGWPTTTAKLERRGNQATTSTCA